MDGAVVLSQSAESALTDAFDRSDVVVLRVAPGFGAAQLVRAWAAKVGATVEVLRTKSPQPLESYESPGPVAVVWAHAEPPMPGPEAVILTAPQLRLSEDEIALLLPESRREAAAEIALQTGGWPALVAAAMSVLAEDDWYDWEVHVRAAVADRLERHSDARLPARWRTTLDWIACADGIAVRETQNTPLVEREVVLQAVEMGLLSWRSSGRQRAAHLLPYARYARLTRVRENAVDYGETLLAIADRRAESGLLDCGLAAAAELEDWPRCARIQDRWWRELLFGDYRDLSESVIRRLPPHLLRAYPRLSLRAEFADRFAPGSTLYEVPRNAKEIEKILADGRATEVLDTTFLGMLSLRINGNPRKAAAIAAQTAPLAILTSRAADSGRDRASLWYVHAGLSAHLAGDESTARAHYQMALSTGRHDSVGFAEADAQSKLAALSALRGENRAARELISAINTEGVVEWVVPHIDMSRRIAEHSILVDSGDGVPIDVETVMLRDPYEFDEMWVFAYVVVARYLIAVGRGRDALNLTQELRIQRPVATRSNGVQPRILALMGAEAHLRLGQGSQALNSLETLGASDPIAAVVRAQVLLHAGELEAARVQATLALGSEAIFPRRRREASLVAAAVAAETGQDEAARALAEAAIADSQAEGDHRLWGGLPERSFGALNRVIELPTTRLDGQGQTPVKLEIIKLTGREKDVLRAMAHGRRQREIAAELFVSLNTIKTQQRGLYRKLGARSGPEALAIASRLGLLDKP